MVAVEDEYLARPAIFNLDGKVVSLIPPEAGLDVDEDTIVDEAMLVGREGSPLSQFTWWLGHIFATVHIPVSGSIDADSVNAIFDTWDAEVIARPANQGGIELVEGELQAVYPADRKWRRSPGGIGHRRVLPALHRSTRASRSRWSPSSPASPTLTWTQHSPKRA